MGDSRPTRELEEERFERLEEEEDALDESCAVAPRQLGQVEDEQGEGSVDTHVRYDCVSILASVPRRAH